MATNITITGKACSDPELKFLPSGAAVANLNVAVNHRRKNQQTQEWEDAGTDFYPVSAWKEMAENVASSVTKGQEVIVVGRLKSRSYETKEGEKRTVWEIEADHIGPSLRRQEAQVRKIQQQAGVQGGHGWGQQPAQGQQQAGGWVRGSSTDPWSSKDDSSAPPL